MAAALVLGLVYNAVILPGYGPDEPRHLRYVALLWDEQRFPFLLPDRSEYHGAHTLHPPLPYIAMLPLYAVARLLPEAAQYHVLRLFSLACALASLPLMYQTALACARSPWRPGGMDDEAGWGRSVALTSLAICVLAPIFGMAAGWSTTMPPRSSPWPCSAGCCACALAMASRRGARSSWAPASGWERCARQPWRCATAAPWPLSCWRATA